MFPARDAVASILIRSRRALADIAGNPALGFATGYATGLVEIQGGLVPALCAILRRDLAQNGQSPQQRHYAVDRAAQMGLEERCQFELRDYREINSVFDEVASIGMLEHVGRRDLRNYFCAMAAALREGGRFCLQVINPVATTGFGNAVFPGSYIPTPAEVLRHAANAGLVSWSERIRHCFRRGRSAQAGSLQRNRTQSKSRLTA